MDRVPVGGFLQMEIGDTYEVIVLGRYIILRARILYSRSL